MIQKTSGRGKGRGKGRGSRQAAPPTPAPGDGEEEEIIDSDGSAADDIAEAGGDAGRNGAPA